MGYIMRPEFTPRKKKQMSSFKKYKSLNREVFNVKESQRHNVSVLMSHLQG